MATVKQTIADLFELEKLPPEKAAELIERLGKLIFQAVLLRVLPTLSEKDMEAYEKLLDSDADGEEVFKFLNDKVPNFNAIVEEEAETLRVEMSNVFESIGLEKTTKSEASSSDDDIESLDEYNWGLEIIGWIARVFWAVLGFILWIPLLFRVVASFCWTLIYHMVTRNPSAIRESRISLKHALNFYKIGFEVIRQTTSVPEPHEKAERIASIKEEFNLASFIPQLVWVIIFWGILLLPLYSNTLSNLWASLTSSLKR